MVEGGSENGNNRLKGKGADRAREEARKEKIRKDQMYTGELKGKGLESNKTPEDDLAVGTILTNRDQALSNPDNADYKIVSATGEPGKRRLALFNEKLRAKLSIEEENLRKKMESGVWRFKE